MTANPAQRLSTTKQFWVLLKFQASTIPRLWPLPVFMAVLYFSDIMRYILNFHSYSPFSTELSNFSLFLVPSLLFLSSRSLFTRNLRTATPTTAHAWVQFEFVLTRAIDRQIFHRALSVLFHLLILAVPVGLLLYSFRVPDRQVWLDSRVNPQEFLHYFPDAGPDPTETPSQAKLLGPILELKGGNTLFLSWHVWALVVGITLVQMFYLINSLRGRRWFSSVSRFVGNFLLVIFELCLGLAWLGLLNNTSLFFAFATHPTVFWICSIAVVICGQFICERLFAQVEQ